MTIRHWLWVGTALDAIVFFPAAYMAFSALDFVTTETPPPIVGIAVLFVMLPIFCVVCPLAAWRALKRDRGTANVIFLMVAPLLYAAFLVEFLYG